MSVLDDRTSAAPREGLFRSCAASAVGLAIALGGWPWLAAHRDATERALAARERDIAELAMLQDGAVRDPGAAAARLAAIADLFDDARLVWCRVRGDGYVAIVASDPAAGPQVAGVALR